MALTSHSSLVCVVTGTRPDTIKMAPLVQALKASDSGVEARFIVTGQHREMLHQVLEDFSLHPDRDLNLMVPGQTLAHVTSKVLEGLDKVWQQDRPDLVLVHGDTTTCLAAGLAAYYQRIPLGHVEAGLRTGDKFNPFPEEINRRTVDGFADLLFAPTPTSAANLQAENIPSGRIFVTGNTVVDALLSMVEKVGGTPIPGLAPEVLQSGRMILVTAHRRENWGHDMEEIFLALKDIVEQFPDVKVVFPVHLNPQVRGPVERLLRGVERIHLLEPLEYRPFCALLRKAHLVLTDSGGIGREAPALGVPVVVLRKVTERPEAVEAGTVVLGGVGRESLVQTVSRLLADEKAYKGMAQAVNPYGDGKACSRIVQIIRRFFDPTLPLPEPFGYKKPAP